MPTPSEVQFLSKPRQKSVISVMTLFALPGGTLEAPGETLSRRRRTRRTLKPLDPEELGGVRQAELGGVWQTELQAGEAWGRAAEFGGAHRWEHAGECNVSGDAFLID